MHPHLFGGGAFLSLLCTPCYTSEASWKPWSVVPSWSPLRSLELKEVKKMEVKEMKDVMEGKNLREVKELREVKKMELKELKELKEVKEVKEMTGEGEGSEGIVGNSQAALCVHLDLTYVA